MNVQPDKSFVYKLNMETPKDDDNLCLYKHARQDLNLIEKRALFQSTKFDTRMSVHKLHPRFQHLASIMGHVSSKYFRETAGEECHESPIHVNRLMRAICIGAGASGLLLAYKLLKCFTDYVLDKYEKNPDISGT
ncbi:uncharacterized protein Z518_08899 [Rhinocladiella mackenziei CBS 650.93]|uniref:Uncharacterized protein n=1 Tax=Rhinocladiella mackenziei CBS 650.93 TaxID=1442369 RepID=A0A0D2I5V3_9EURO|nr:uncharacterized protein Z518_08899 [Rhinocladiella mackenziei CBS 650.93]KIX01174.1 hypothetical protein Z518_08899 [Rhinocladiella mackenziei CBS 650.93]